VLLKEEIQDDLRGCAA